MRRLYLCCVLLILLSGSFPAQAANTVEPGADPPSKAYFQEEVPVEAQPVNSRHFAKFSSNLMPTRINTVHIVKRVVDGDTLVLSNGDRVRLIGVDTPETVHPRKGVEYFGKEASRFTKRMIEGKKIRLEYEWHKSDRYGRLLAYVYRESDNLFLNEEIIRQGYGHVYTRFPFKYLDQFRSLEKEARLKQRGLWKKR